MYTLLTLLMCCGLCTTNAAVSSDTTAYTHNSEQLFIEDASTGHHPHHKAKGHKKRDSKKDKSQKKSGPETYSAPKLPDQIILGTVQLPHKTTIAAPSAPVENAKYSYSVVMDSPQRTVVTIKFKTDVKPKQSAIVGTLVYHKKQDAASPYYWICEAKSDLDKAQNANTVCVVIENPEPSKVTVKSFKFAIIQ